MLRPCLQLLLLLLLHPLAYISSYCCSYLSPRLEEPPLPQARDPLYYISNDLQLRRGEVELSRSNSSLQQQQREQVLQEHRRRLQEQQERQPGGRSKQGPPTAPKPIARAASYNTSSSSSSSDQEMKEQDYIRHVTNTDMKTHGAENRPFNYIAFRFGFSLSFIFCISVSSCTGRRDREKDRKLDLCPMFEACKCGNRL